MRAPARRRGVLIACPVAVAAIALATAPAWAAFPPFTVEVTPSRPVAGERVEIVVRAWEDAEHTRPASLVGPEVVDNLIAAYPADRYVGRARTDGRLPIVLRQAGPASFRGAIVFPAPGTWLIVSFPDSLAPSVAEPGYPDVIEVEVESTGAGPSAVVPTALAAGLALLVGAWLTLRPRRGTGRPSGREELDSKLREPGQEEPHRGGRV